MTPRDLVNNFLDKCISDKDKVNQSLSILFGQLNKRELKEVCYIITNGIINNKLCAYDEDIGKNEK